MVFAGNFIGSRAVLPLNLDKQMTSCQDMTRTHARLPAGADLHTQGETP